MQPHCRICGHFIAEHTLWDMDSVECCDKHGFIKICGPCWELFEKYGSADKCIINFVREYKKILDSEYHPRYACPNCDYISFTFSAASNHMFAKNHLYQGVGTYPIFVAPGLQPNLIPHSGEALKILAKQAEVRSCISKETK